MLFIRIKGLLFSILLAINLLACAQQQSAIKENTPKPQPSSTVTPTPTPISTPVPITPSPTPFPSEIKFGSKKVNEHVEDVYDIKAEYPQIKSLRSKQAIAFNRWLEKFVLNDVVEFRGLERAAMKKNKGKPSPSIGESLDISYEVIFASKDLISLAFSQKVMALGQMHPIDYPVPVNYDLKKGRLLKLNDLFRPKANFLKAFSQYCQAELKRQYGEQLFMEGTEAKAKNYKNWNINPEGIMISFDDYQVGPHAMGQPVIVIPYSTLKGMIARNSVVDKFLNVPQTKLKQPTTGR